MSLGSEGLTGGQWSGLRTGWQLELGGLWSVAQNPIGDL